MRVYVEHDPDTPEEQFLRELIAELQRDYLERAKPLLDRLAKIHELKSRTFLITDDAGRPDRWVVVP